MLNQIVLMGRLTRDPELRRTQSGLPVATFTLAVDRDYGKNENGEKQTDFIDIVAWRNSAEFVSKYFAKGNLIVVTGKLQLRDWTDRDGNKRRSAEVVADNFYFGESKRSAQERGNYQGGYQNSGYQDGGYQNSGYQNNGYQGGGYTSPVKGSAFEDLSDDGEDDLPF